MGNRAFLVSCAGLLVLAAVFFAAHPAFAQTQEACPLPAGATPVAPPRVPAQQVRRRPQSPEGFRAVCEGAVQRTGPSGHDSGTRAIYRMSRTAGGSVFRSGSTYIVSLTLDGRVFLHAKDRPWRGRLLNPLIYAEILAELGVSPVDSPTWRLPSPIRATALSPWSSPHCRRSRMARSMPPPPCRACGQPYPVLRATPAVYVSPNLGLRSCCSRDSISVSLHLVPVSAEVIDYGDPTITARDVVDRRTLKAFVTQAGNYKLELQRTGDAAAASKARMPCAIRTGRGGTAPYLYVLDTVTNVITFHAAFPDRFENRPLVPTVRDAVTGEFILPQVIEAAKSSPGRRLRGVLLRRSRGDTTAPTSPS